MNTIKYGAAMLFLTAQSLAITPINGGAISGGTPVTINISDGDQTDPHVSGDIAAYTDIAGSSIRYFNFATHVDAAIPTTPDVIDILSDVSGSRIAFSRIEIDRNALMVFDTSTATLTEIDPHAGTNRYITAIGGNTVAFIDFGSLGVVSPGQGDVYAYDLSTSTLQAISNDPAAEDNPNVSPDGNVIVWERCPISLTNCDILQAVRNGGSWTVSVVAGSSDPEGNPDTNGTLVVYDAAHPASPTGQDIYFVPVAGGATTQLEIPGDQQNPSISGGVIAFESRATPTSDTDIFLYVIATNTLWQVTNTPGVDETLSDVTVLPNGQVRIVWAANDGVQGTQNIYATTFSLPASCRQVVLDASVTMPISQKYALFVRPPTYVDAVVSPTPPLPFLLPAKLPVVRGNASTGLSELLVLHGTALTGCLYQGADAGSDYNLLLCIPTMTAGSQITGNTIGLRVLSGSSSPTAAVTTEVRVPLQDASCAH
jgi:hypothetical protein